MRLRDYPGTLIVNDIMYNLKFVPVVPTQRALGPLVGFCCLESQTIFIRKKQGPIQRLSTVIHEVVHALDEEWDIGLTHDQVYKLETALLRLLLDNNLIPVL